MLETQRGVWIFPASFDDAAHAPRTIGCPAVAAQLPGHVRGVVFDACGTFVGQRRDFFLSKTGRPSDLHATCAKNPHPRDTVDSIALNADLLVR